MNYIEEIVREVERVYDELDNKALYFRLQSGLRCVAGCSSCCTFKNIRASVLEMMPLAWYLHLNNLQDEMKEQLDRDHAYCALYKGVNADNRLGGCLYYDQRPLICRLFGNAGIPVKQGHVAIYTCRIMKSSDPQIFDETMRRIQDDLEIPMAHHFQSRLDMIEYTLACDIYPINISIQKALDKVSFYFRGKPNPRKFRRIG